METLSGEIDINVIATSANIVVVDIASEWCSPCKALAPILESLQEDFKDVKFIKVDVTNGAPTFVSEMGIRAVPTILFYKGGNLVRTETGFKAKKDLKLIIENL